jgi:hypothetical protein
MTNKKLSTLDKVNILRIFNHITKQLKNSLKGFNCDVSIAEQQDLMIIKVLKYSKIITEDYKSYFKCDLEVKEKLPNGEVIFEWKMTPKENLPNVSFDFNFELPVDK